MLWSTFSLKLILKYLWHCKQKIKRRSSFSSCFDVYIGITQGSVLGPLLFNIAINDLLLNIAKSDVCDFADENTLYSFDKKLENIFSNLTYDPKNVLNWFLSQFLKFHFVILGDRQKISFVLKINDKKINSSSSFSEVKLLGFYWSSTLCFHT